MTTSYEKDSNVIEKWFAGVFDGGRREQWRTGCFGAAFKASTVHLREYHQMIMESIDRKVRQCFLMPTIKIVQGKPDTA